MSDGSVGYFFADPAQQDALARRQAYAKALIQAGLQDPGSSRYGGLANAGKEIAGALLNRWNTEEGQKLSDADKAKRDALVTSLLGDQSAPSTAGPLNASPMPSAQGSLSGMLPQAETKTLASMLMGMPTEAAGRMIPGVVNDAYARQDAAERPMTAQEKQQYGIHGDAAAMINGMGQVKVTQPSDVMSPQGFQQHLAIQRAGRIPVANWQVMIDPLHLDEKGNPTYYRYDATSGHATTLDGRSPYSPMGAQKVGPNAAAVVNPERKAQLQQDAARFVASGYDTKTVPNDVKGFGGAYLPMKQAFQQAVNEYETSHGLTPTDVLAGGAEIKADTHSLLNMSKLYDSTASQEKAMHDAFNNVNLLMNKGAGYAGGTVFNRWLQAGRQGVASDPDVMAFNTAINTVTGMYARIHAGLTTGAGSSDAARETASEMLNKFGSPKAVMEQWDVMQRDAAYKKNSYLSQMQDIRKRFGASPNPQQEPVSTAPFGTPQANTAAAGQTQLQQPPNTQGWSIQKVQ